MRYEPQNLELCNLKRQESVRVEIFENYKGLNYRVYRI